VLDDDKTDPQNGVPMRRGMGSRVLNGTVPKIDQGGPSFGWKNPPIELKKGVIQTGCCEFDEVERRDTYHSQAIGGRLLSTLDTVPWVHRSDVHGWLPE